jgi:hypothetical protein
VNELQQRCKLIQGSFHESKVPPRPADWRERLFDVPLAPNWEPVPGHYVYLRPGTTIGGLCPDRALVTHVLRGMVDVRVQNIRRWKSRLLPLDDVRPIE